MIAAAPLPTLLAELKRSSSVRAIALIGRDGTPLSADLPPGTHAESFAMMCATAFGAAATACAELGNRSPIRLAISTGDTFAILAPNGPAALLAVQVEPGASVDAVRSLTEALGHAGRDP